MALEDGLGTDAAASGLQKGTNQSGVRLYNERLVLSLIRARGSLPKAEIARLTGLSAQTISMIVRQLDSDGLLVEQARRRGRIGQPSVPYSLHPEGAFTFGFYVGRRSAGLILMDFLGTSRGVVRQTYAYPTPQELVAFIERGVRELSGRLPAALLSRITGLGIATPFQLWNWAGAVGAPASVLEEWRSFDMEREVAAATGLAVHVVNDGTSACAAEFMFGPHHASDFVYFYVGSFVGGGIVINGSLVPGRFGYAGSVGSMPVPNSDYVEGSGAPRWRQLIFEASIHVLERRLTEVDGRDPLFLWQAPENWDGLGRMLDDWIAMTADGLTHAIAASASVYDFPLAIIDGGFPGPVRTRLVAEVNRRLDRFDFQGLRPVTAIEGSLGRDARAIGAAALPLVANFARDREVLFKEQG